MFYELNARELRIIRMALRNRLNRLATRNARSSDEEREKWCALCEETDILGGRVEQMLRMEKGV